MRGGGTAPASLLAAGPSASRMGKSAGGKHLEAGKRLCEKEAAGMTAWLTERDAPICSGMQDIARSCRGDERSSFVSGRGAAAAAEKLAAAASPVPAGARLPR